MCNFADILIMFDIRIWLQTPHGRQILVISACNNSFSFLLFREVCRISQMCSFLLFGILRFVSSSPAYVAVQRLELMSLRIHSFAQQTRFPVYFRSRFFQFFVVRVAVFSLFQNVFFSSRVRGRRGGNWTALHDIPKRCPAPTLNCSSLHTLLSLFLSSCCTDVCFVCHLPHRTPKVVSECELHAPSHMCREAILWLFQLSSIFLFLPPFPTPSLFFVPSVDSLVLLVIDRNFFPNNGAPHAMREWKERSLSVSFPSFAFFL